MNFLHYESFRQNVKAKASGETEHEMNSLKSYVSLTTVGINKSNSVGLRSENCSPTLTCTTHDEETASARANRGGVGQQERQQQQNRPTTPTQPRGKKHHIVSSAAPNMSTTTRVTASRPVLRTRATIDQTEGQRQKSDFDSASQVLKQKLEEMQDKLCQRLSTPDYKVT